MGEPRRRRLGLGPGPALLPEGRARPRFRRALARQGRAHSGTTHPARALDRARQGGGEGFRGQGLQVPARPERRIRRGLLPGHALQRRGAARVGGAWRPTHTDAVPPPTAAERRESAAMGYLAAETRKRPNLTISTDTQVKSRLFEGTQCVGVTAMIAGKEQEFRAKEVILSSGAIHTPAHLMRAGIGPVGHLSEMGIPVVAALPGVGQRLMDHPSIALSSFLRRGARMNQHTRRHIHLALRYSSKLPGIPMGDMFTVVVAKSAWHAVGEQIGSLLTFINKTYSETGQVKRAPRGYLREPLGAFNPPSGKRDSAG